MLFLDCQDRKTNSFICFLEEAVARQFCFEICWPLDSWYEKYNNHFLSENVNPQKTEQLHENLGLEIGKKQTQTQKLRPALDLLMFKVART